MLLHSTVMTCVLPLHQHTALHIASEGGHCDIAKLLLKFNADSNCYLCKRLTCMQWHGQNIYVRDT